MANELYEQEQGVGFDMRHCYELLKSSPKWSSELQARSRKAAKTNAAAEAAADHHASTEGEVRPIGNKKAKSRARKAQDDVQLELLEIARRAEEQSNKRLAILEQLKEEEKKKRTELEIMRMDLTRMDEISREYFMRKKQKIISRMRESDA
ncbi:No apical meristem-associated, C-terminal domain-containing protein [Dichotomocladium elegans]|nr:No apical meristem-associated, C-terminal domain-containing protein [Dichotomocladium elegans]